MSKYLGILRISSEQGAGHSAPESFLSYLGVAPEKPCFTTGCEQAGASARNLEFSWDSLTLLPALPTQAEVLLLIPCYTDFLDACGQLSSSSGKVSVCHFEIIKTFPGYRSRLSTLHHNALFPDPVYCLIRAHHKGRAHPNTAVKYILAILPAMPAASNSATCSTQGSWEGSWSHPGARAGCSGQYWARQSAGQ